MSSPPNFPVAGIRAFGNTFKQECRKLNREQYKRLFHVLDELLADRLKPGRHLERLEDGPTLYSVRLNQGFRLVFSLDADRMVTLVAVGPHDVAYRRT